MANAITTTEEFSSPTPESSEVRFYEVVGGQIVEKPAMGAVESLLASLLWRWMAPHVDENQLGRVVCETLFLLDPALKLKSPTRPGLCLDPALAAATPRSSNRDLGSRSRSRGRGRQPDQRCGTGGLKDRGVLSRGRPSGLGGLSGYQQSLPVRHSDQREDSPGRR